MAEARARAPDPSPMTPQQTASPAARPFRLGGLDGLRAIAVCLVLGCHLFPSALPGGFLGVDVFFAISGFLITTLLLREHRTSGRVRLGSFWRRRARRLLPALGLVLVTCTALALLVGRDLLVGIGRQVVGAALFVSNWTSISAGADYFSADTPELFRNTWSLSIEEQFYLVLPFLLLALVRFRRRWVRALPLLLLGVASALLMATLAATGADATRVYFGSDTHTFGLLLGAALAMLTAPKASAPGALSTAPAALGRVAQLGLAALTCAGLATLGWLAFTITEAGAESFAGGFQLATVAALVTVWAVSRPGAWAGIALDARPLRWIGERSYGIYLWHWPLLLIITAWLGAVSPWWIAGCTLAATVAAAALSYRFVEEPVRRFGLRRSLAMLLRPAHHTARRRTVAIALGVVLLTTVPAAGVAVATAPKVSSGAAAVDRGRAVQDSAAATPSPAAPAPEDEASASAPATPATPTGSEVNAIGDSVMLASLPELEAHFPGISVDAEVSRGMGVGVELSERLASDGGLRQVLVVGLGTNGPVDTAELDALRASAQGRPLVLVNAHADRDWIPGVNAALAEYADAHRGVVVADWNGSISRAPSSALAGDGIHPNPNGGELYAACVQQALDDLQRPGEGIGYGLPRR